MSETKTTKNNDNEPSKKRPRTMTEENEEITTSTIEKNEYNNNNNNKEDDIDFLAVPPELQNVDFTKRIAWSKYQPYTTQELPLVPLNTPPVFTKQSPALCFHVHGTCGRARATTLHLPHGPVATPIFMPVGTKGTLKGLTVEEIKARPELNCPIMLANTYHMALQPGTQVVRDMGGLHTFMNWDRPLLTDSGGFQMVSLLKLAEITEQGVTFESPFEDDYETDDEHEEDENDGTPTSEQDNGTSATTDGDESNGNNNNNNNNNNNTDKSKRRQQQSKKSSSANSRDLVPSSSSTDNNNTGTATTTNNNNKKRKKKKKKTLLLKPEDSIHHQNDIGSDIIMALDDVVSSVTDDNERFTIATYRTLRWLDRCYEAHRYPTKQNLFPIVQGGLDTSLGGLREQCLAGFQHRDDHIVGYAIGGLAGGETKDDFWKVVNQCCKALPDTKPRYLMGVGYPLDLVICSALGVDMYDCVYPTRTARFGVALVSGPTPGTLRLKSNDCSTSSSVIQDGCQCQACAGGISRARLYTLLQRNNPVAIQLVTQHNIAYMMNLVRSMRQAIMENRYDQYVKEFVHDQFRGKDNNGEDIPTWVRDACHAAGIEL